MVGGSFWKLSSALVRCARDMSPRSVRNLKPDSTKRSPIIFSVSAYCEKTSVLAVDDPSRSPPSESTRKSIFDV